MIQRWTDPLKGITRRVLPRPVRRRLRRLIHRDAGAAPQRARAPFAEKAARILGPEAVTILDVGARWASDFDAWYRIAPLGGLLGFEPDEEECARLNDASSPSRRFVPLALGAKTGTRTLHITREPACSSLYPPNPDFTDRYAGTSIMCGVRETTVQTVRLDEWARREDLKPIAFMKLDVQGAELDVLHGAGTLLSDCLGLEIEVEFNEMYRGQPLFADVDYFVRAQGFHLWRLEHLVHYSERPLSGLHRTETASYSDIPTRMPAGSGRLYWGHALYLRDYMDLAPSKDRLLAALTLISLLDAAEEDDGRDAALRDLLSRYPLDAGERKLLVGA